MLIEQGNDGAYHVPTMLTMRLTLSHVPTLLNLTGLVLICLGICFLRSVSHGQQENMNPAWEREAATCSCSQSMCSLWSA